MKRVSEPVEELLLHLADKFRFFPLGNRQPQPYPTGKLEPLGFDVAQWDEELYSLVLPANTEPTAENVMFYSAMGTYMFEIKLGELAKQLNKPCEALTREDLDAKCDEAIEEMGFDYPEPAKDQFARMLGADILLSSPKVT